MDTLLFYHIITEFRTIKKWMALWLFMYLALEIELLAKGLNR